MSPHVLKRMIDREFTEVDLRLMLDVVASIKPDMVAGRWVLSTHFRKRRWEVIVEPDFESKRLVVITAYPVWKSLV